MPRTLMHSVRGYKTKQFWDHEADNQNVMKTRSGLVMRSIPIKCKPSQSIKTKARHRAPVPCTPPGDWYKVKKVVKYKSMSHLSFVMRYGMILRGTELDLSGHPKDTDEWTEDLPFDYDKDRWAYGGDTDDDNEADYDDDDSNSDIASSQEPASSVDSDLDGDLVIDLGDEEDRGDSVSSSPLLASLLPKPAGGQHRGARSRTASFSVGGGTTSQRATITFKTAPFDPTATFLHQANPQQNSTLDYSLSAMGFSNISGNYPTRNPGEPRGYAVPSSEYPVLESYIQMTDASGHKIYRCPDCKKIFTNFAAFQNHAFTHVKTRNRCEVCGKVFSRSWLLKGHLRTHTGERPYTCAHAGCDKAFADKSNLRSHALIHTVVDKNHVCKKCHRAFAQKRYLHKHRLEVCKY